MIRKNERWLNQTGLNLIRIVIGSYFAAVSLDLVTGVDQNAMFLPFLPADMADIAGSTLLFVISIAFMLGISLRHIALVLALFVFCSSLMENFVLHEVEDVSAFWRDVTMVCAIILSYSNMSRHELRRADLVRRRTPRIRKIQLPESDVMPRRVTSAPSEQPEAKRTDRPVLVLPAFMKPPAEREDNRDWIDINLFANI